MELGPNNSILANSLPCGVVKCGTDDEGHEAYVARVSKGSELLPASYIPDKKAAWTCYGSGAYWLTEYVEVLVLDDCDIKWVRGEDGSYPPDAIPTGFSDDGEVTYTGRATFRGLLKIGIVHPSEETMFIAHQQRARCIRCYDVLVMTPREPVDR
ncbi:uncharacterized protein Dana_GF12778 [Drosophila ananassae]|uniref:Uncharacterized protein n=1 Tax=Drosophila ananassae TaxID=7217 RepID=B3MBE3_DROAN|nr:uncharacterized protein LOC6495624 [Drosophila ananassae]EDV36068.1 uncharacterized protein Dana_GF12778 [Drosophila ananassae]